MSSTSDNPHEDVESEAGGPSATSSSDRTLIADRQQTTTYASHATHPRQAQPATAGPTASGSANPAALAPPAPSSIGTSTLLRLHETSIALDAGSVNSGQQGSASLPVDPDRAELSGYNVDGLLTDVFEVPREAFELLVETMMDRDEGEGEEGRSDRGEGGSGSGSSGAVSMRDGLELLFEMPAIQALFKAHMEDEASATMRHSLLLDTVVANTTGVRAAIDEYDEHANAQFKRLEDSYNTKVSKRSRRLELGLLKIMIQISQMLQEHKEATQSAQHQPSASSSRLPTADPRTQEAEATPPVERVDVSTQTDPEMDEDRPSTRRDKGKGREQDPRGPSG